jgi:enoyl-CoA hydratase/carnithine racemase
VPAVREWLTENVTSGIAWKTRVSPRFDGYRPVGGVAEGLTSGVIEMTRFASDRAVFGQPEVGVGAVPGAGAMQHLTRLMGRGRALEALLGADDFTADLAERYGWINRALPDDELPAFISVLARRIARFPSAAIADAKSRVNDIALPSADALREDSQLFLTGLTRPESQARINLLFERGMQTNGSLEAGFGLALADLASN